MKTMYHKVPQQRVSHKFWASTKFVYIDTQNNVYWCKKVPNSRIKIDFFGIPLISEKNDFFKLNSTKSLIIIDFFLLIDFNLLPTTK